MKEPNMEEELQKRNTDCVYFLASPLTCKKGIDCEYRHNEIARLNPRDCWYWLAGNCLNPTCGFRHPPLDKHAEAPSDSASLPNQSSVPANKTSIPCYFYLNGFCNKGDRCSFLHGPGGSTRSGTSVKTSLAFTDALPLDNKTSVGSETMPASIEARLNPSETASQAAVDMKLQPKEYSWQPASKNMMQQSPPQITVSQCEEATAIKSHIWLPAEGFIKRRSLMCTDQSSEELEPEERWESSPGFDVLVDNKSENLGYEDDQEYLMALGREHRELNSHFLGYNFEDPVEYDPAYLNAEVMCEGERYDSVDHVDNVRVFDDVGRDYDRSRDRTFDSLLSQKRKLLSVELAINDRRGVDLREHLRKRRVIDGHPFTRQSRRRHSSRLLGQGARSQERPQRHNITPRLDGRLASEVGKNAIELLGGNETISNGSSQHGWHRHSRSNRSRQRYKEKRLAKRRFHSSEVPRKSIPRESRSVQASTAFTGPKTLAQIKEERKKAEVNGDCTGKTGNSSCAASADFEGPKPLSEILKDKRRLISVRDATIDISN